MGAWIETIQVPDSDQFLKVAPYMCAWIETLVWDGSTASPTSHPIWVRGSKLEGNDNEGGHLGRTLYGCVD